MAVKYVVEVLANLRRPKRKPKELAIVLCAWLLPACVAVSAVVFYMVVAWFPNHRYLEWVEAHPNCDLHLPDVILDANKDYGNYETKLTTAHDTLPGVCLLAAISIILWTGDLRVWNRFLFTEAFIISMINLVQQSTLIPSSYGYKRCVDYLKITSSKDDYFQVKATGSCVAMVWSGHVFHAMLGSYMASTALERKFPRLRRRLPYCYTGPLVKTIFVFFLAGVELTMILLDKAHYTQDVEISILVCLLVFTNDHLEYFFFLCNPFMRMVGCDRPYKRKVMREALRDAEDRVRELEDMVAQLQKAADEHAEVNQEGSPQTPIPISRREVPNERPPSNLSV